jgi:hypothetical protein
MRYIRLFAAPFGMSLQTLALVLLALAAQAGLAEPAQAQIPIVKKLCAGAPVVPFDPLNDSANCMPAQVVPVNSPAFYVITVTNPPGVPPRIISLADAFPGFTLSGPVTCRDPAGAAVALAGTNVANGIGEFALGSSATVICFAPGQFTSTGSKSNIATVKDKETGTQGSGGFTVQVVAPTPLNTDLELSKTVSTGPADVTGGPATLTYTITIHNNGPMVDVGNLFVLHDNLRLLPNSVPLRATLMSWTCTKSVATTQCLNSAGPVPASPPPVLIGTMAPVPMFSWGFAPGPPGNGRIDAGATITLTIVMKIEKLPAWTCVQQLNADGLRNTVFFTLANATAGTAMTELDASDNTAFVDKSVLTGTNVVPGCGQGQLRITKRLITSQPLAGFAWNLPFIEYEIRVTNVSMPAQPIVIQPTKLQDWVAVGVNTPLPRRTTPPASTNCITPFTCGASFAVTPSLPPFQYSYYTQSAKAWQSASGFVLQYGATARFRTRLRYDNPACDTVPNAHPKLMWNIAMVDYFATPVGMSGPLQAYHGEASVPVLMQGQPPCPFVVKKQLVSSPAKVTFGSVLQYQVQYSNVGPTQQTVGTAMDAVRITDPGYALSLPFSSSWFCSGAAVGNLNASGFLTGGGSAPHTISPAHGSPAIRLHANPSLPLVFPANSTLTCQVIITVQRPSFNDPFCTTNPVQFENFGMMDKALPYNPNPIAWPPGVSGLYVPTSASNPSPQSRNWASVRIPLPRCFGAIINKEATVDGLPPTSAPWIFTNPGAPDIHYKVKVTNTAQSALTGSGTVLTTLWNGLMVVDALGLPYTAGALQPDGPICPGGWCAPGLNLAVGVGAASLAPLQTGIWQFKYPGSQFSTGKNMVNCARVVASGSFTTPDWYPNYNPAAPSPSPTNTTIANPQHSCITIPIFERATVQVTKITRTPQGALLPNAGPFPVNLTCAPYFIPNSSSNGTVSTTLSTGSNGSSQPWIVNNVPAAPTETCQVSEGNLASVPVPQPPAPLCPPGQNAQWGPPAIVPASFSPVPGVNQVTVTNKLICVAQLRELTVRKIVNSPSVPAPSGPFTIQLNCIGGGAIPPSVTLNNGGSAIVQIPLNATCTPTEPILPPPPVVPGLICTWNPAFFQPPGPFAVNLSGPPGLIVINSPNCVKP